MSQDFSNNNSSAGISFAQGKRAEYVPEPELTAPPERHSYLSDSVLSAKVGSLAAQPAAAKPGSYLDHLDNTSEDIKDIKKSNDKKISPKDKKIISLLAALNLLVFAFIGCIMSFFLIVSAGVLVNLKVLLVIMLMSILPIAAVALLMLK